VKTINVSGRMRVAALAVALGASTLVAYGWTGGGVERNSAIELPRDEATRNRMRAELERISAQRAAEGGPTLFLPEDQRAGWIAAWNKLRECTLGRGFEGVTPVMPTFGDGQTRAPIIFGAGPIADAALAACPFDTSLFDAAKVQAAADAWFKRGASD
jgi:hypothetical protein